jgi:hypothetical protein
MSTYPLEKLGRGKLVENREHKKLVRENGFEFENVRKSQRKRKMKGRMRREEKEEERGNYINKIFTPFVLK